MRWSIPRRSECQKAKGRARSPLHAVLFAMQASGAHRSDAPYRAARLISSSDAGFSKADVVRTAYLGEKLGDMISRFGMSPTKNLVTPLLIPLANAWQGVRSKRPPCSRR